MAHTCHAVGCERSVPPQMLMCKPHWFKVPLQLRNRVWATYQDGQCLKTQRFSCTICFR